MNPTRTTAALLLAAALLAGCSEPSYEQAADQCIAAVKALPKGAQSKPRPKACERLKDQDYNLIFADKTLRDAGLISGTPTPRP